jgi:hypothetical protein
MRAFDIAEMAKDLFACAEQLPGREHAGAKIACTTVTECRGCLPLRNLQAVDISTIDEVGTI